MEEIILKNIYESVNNNKAVALVTLTKVTGSSPGKCGSMMAVWEDSSIKGSVGGGQIEHLIIEKALGCIDKNENTTFQYTLDNKGELDMQCGGVIEGFIKVFSPKPKFLIVGAGHVALYLYQIAKVVGFHTVVFDDREDFANKERFPEADEIILGPMDDALSKYDTNKNTYIVLVTRGHKDDKTALQAAICKECAYIGMIGSSKKTAHIMKTLVSEGVSREDLQKVYSPIGLDIACESPQEIALSILSEILLVKNKGSLNHMKSLKSIPF